jgi:pimeloyl-ACP methyl ester carboxylesterase
MMEPLQIPARGLVFDALAAGPPTGELVVLLHGFPQTSACWTPLLATLAVAGYRAVAPDQRGYSPTARPTTVAAYRMPQLVADVVAIADRLGVETFHLVGHDWGGVVAWRLAGRHPDRVATLTAVSTPHPRAFARALVAGTQALRSAYIPVFRIPRLPELLLGAHRQWGLRRLLAQDGLGVEWVDTYTRALAQPGALSAALAWYRAATPFSVRAPRVGYRRCMSGAQVIRRWDPGRLPRAGAGSPAPTGSRSLLVPATGCLSSTPRSWVACCWSTCDGGRPGQQRREDGPADIECGTKAWSRRVHDLGIRLSAEGTWGRNPARVGTGRRPPEAARRRLPPGTNHGSRREEPTAESTPGNRSRRSRFRRPDAIPRRLPCLE